MLSFASAILILTFNSVFAAPLAPHLVDSAPANVTHHHIARNWCKPGGAVNVSYKKGFKFGTTKTTLNLKTPAVEGSLCVYPIGGGWPGLAADAVAVTTYDQAGVAGATDFSSYRNLMARTGDLLQDKVSGNGQTWFVVDRSGSYVKDTESWMDYLPSEYDPSPAAQRMQRAACSKMIEKLHRKVYDQLAIYKENGFGYSYLSFDQIALSEDWSRIRFLRAPVISNAAAELRDIITNLDIQAADSYIVSASGKQTQVAGVCQRS